MMAKVSLEITAEGKLETETDDMNVLSPQVTRRRNG